jgi:hypothetical protein
VKLSDPTYKTITLPVVLHGCETWFVPLREEHRLKVLENRVLKRISGPKWDLMTGGRRKLHNEEFHVLNTLSQLELERDKRACSTNERTKMHVDYWCEIQRESNH